MRGSSYLENKIIPEADIILFLNLIEDLKSDESFKGIGRPLSFNLAQSYQTMTLKAIPSGSGIDAVPTPKDFAGLEWLQKYIII